MVSQAPGFVSGFWMEVRDGKGHAVWIFETEDAANRVAEQVRSIGPSAARAVESVDVREVVAHA
jgi:hypothetical protein